MKDLPFKKLDRIIVYLGIAIVLALVLYIGIRISQEWSIRGDQSAKEQQVADQRKELSEKTKNASDDQQRKIDVTNLNSAAKAYFLAEKKAPDELSLLSPKYVANFPKDPNSGQEYKYILSNDKKTWKISAILSDNSLFEVKGP